MKILYQSQGINHRSIDTNPYEMSVNENLSQVESGELKGHDNEMYAEAFSVEISEEGRAALEDRILNDRDWEEAQKKFCEERDVRFQEMTKGNYAQKLHHIFPNVWTNDKIERALEDQPWETENETFEIIYSKILPYEIGDMTEQERKAQIAEGLSDLKKISGRLSPDKASLFMEAMQEVAKYGYDGKRDSEGYMEYDIKEGPPLGALVDYETFYERMERIDPDAYAKYIQMRNEEFERTGSWACWDAKAFASEWVKQNPYIVPQNTEVVEEEETEEEETDKKTKENKIAESIEAVKQEQIKAFQNYAIRQNKMQTVSYLMNSMKHFSAYV